MCNYCTSFHNESALSPPFQIWLSGRPKLLGVASTSLAGAGRGGRAVHRWVRCHISIERVSLDKCMMRRHTIKVMPATTSAIAVMEASTNYPRGQMPSHPVQRLLKSAVIGRGGDLIKKLPYGLELGWSTAADVGGGYVGGGGYGDESMMAATGVEQQTKAKGGQQQRTAVYCERQRKEADVGEWRRK